MNWNEKVEKIQPLDAEAMEQARKRQYALAKPAGSFGKLEQLSIQIAGITGTVINRIDRKAHILFGADNGVYEEGVAATPQHFTKLLMQFYSGAANCGINVLCRHHGIDLKLVNVGVKNMEEYPGIDHHPLMNGTNNFCKEKAMPKKIAEKAIEIGFSYAEQAKQEGYQILGNGEVGMGNTTTSAACIMACLGLDDPEIAVGRGAGLTDEGFLKKKRAVQRGLQLHSPNSEDAVDILSKVGGLDLAAMCGLYLGAAYCRIPIVVDGVISIAGALLAYCMNPLARDYMILSHCSREPAYQLAMEELGMNAMLDLDMRLGEGTGCPLAMSVIEDALVLMEQMSTFEQARLETEYRKPLIL